MYPQFKNDDVSYELINRQVNSLIRYMKDNKNSTTRFVTAESFSHWWHIITRMLIIKQTEPKCPYCTAKLSFHDKCKYCGKQVWSDVLE